MLNDSVTKVLRRNLQQAMRGGNLEQAAELVERLQQEDFLSLETRGLTLEYLLRRGDLDGAAVLVTQLLELFPESSRIHYLAGIHAYRQKRYPVALERFRESDLMHTHWKSRHWLAKTLTQMGRMEEAEPILLKLVEKHARCRSDLAWLYERQQRFPRAIEILERHLKEAPNDRFAQDQLQRLRARDLTPEGLQEEVDTLTELGEEIPEQIMPEYLETLLSTGQGGVARSFVAERLTSLQPGLAGKMGWVCHHHLAYDLAMDLFLQAFPEQRENYKFLSALEAAAIQCQRVAGLVAYYETHAQEDKRLYGRMKRLMRQLESN